MEVRFTLVSIMVNFDFREVEEGVNLKCGCLSGWYIYSGMAFGVGYGSAACVF